RAASLPERAQGQGGPAARFLGRRRGGLALPRPEMGEPPRHEKRPAPTVLDQEEISRKERQHRKDGVPRRTRHHDWERCIWLCAKPTCGRTSRPTTHRGIMIAESHHPARWFHLRQDGRLQCDLCPRDCALADGQRGLCFVRKREGDQMVLSTYGRSSGFCVDP